MGVEERKIVNMPKNLQTGLYKTVVKLKKVLEADWAVGHRGKGYDLPTMAAGCEYGGVEKYGFSGKKGKKERADIIYPLDKLLLSKLSKFSLRDKKIPRIVFKKHRKPNNQYEYTSEVKWFVGTCAEDNAANLILHDLGNNKPADLKSLTFAHPVRTRTLKRERMCEVCRDLFTEP